MPSPNSALTLDMKSFRRKSSIAESLIRPTESSTIPGCRCLSQSPPLPKLLSFGARLSSLESAFSSLLHNVFGSCSNRLRWMDKSEFLWPSLLETNGILWGFSGENALDSEMGFPCCPEAKGKENGRKSLPWNLSPVNCFVSGTRSSCGAWRVDLVCVDSSCWGPSVVLDLADSICADWKADLDCTDSRCEDSKVDLECVDSRCEDWKVDLDCVDSRYEGWKFDLDCVDSRCGGWNVDLDRTDSRCEDRRANLDCVDLGGDWEEWRRICDKMSLLVLSEL